ncbi:MAG: flagellar biosynthetic protein FliR [Bacteriovoracia bacterium]
MNFFEWDEIKIFTFFFTLIRTGSLLLFVPILGDKNVPATVKILLSVAIAFILYPMVWATGQRVGPDVYNHTGQIVLHVVSEICFGMLLGLVTRWVFDAVQFAGQFIGTSIGFSMASVVDPHTETQAIAISELKYILAAMLFLSFNGHHIFLETILQSFHVVPLTKIAWSANVDGILNFLISMTSAVISLGTRLAAPILVVILITNVSFSMLARAVSQMNVLVISFAANLIVGLVVLLFSFPGFLNLVQTSFDGLVPEIAKLLRLMHG